MSNMRIVKIAALAAVLLVSGSLTGAPGQALYAQESGETSAAVFRRAQTLYENGMFSEAKSAFESLGEDPMARGYAVLCAVAMRQKEAPQLVSNYLDAVPYSPLRPQLVYRSAANAFEEGDYEEAQRLYAAVNEDDLFASQRDDYCFRLAFSAFSNGDYGVAKPRFEKLAEGPYTDYTAPSRYCLGYMAYNDSDFVTARKHFLESAKDPRFEQISNYYLVECAFLAEDYAYVTENGPLLYENSPVERQPHLSRLISEAYLIQGDTEGAEAYYRRAIMQNDKMDRTDYFYAGSVLYNIDDWKGAIENFSQMTERTDSLGQIAAYQMGYSYIKTRDKVSALAAFQEAAQPAENYDPALTEDAHFNWAKLAFDLNQDPSVFESFIDQYNTKEKTDQIYQYIALAALYRNDYEAAIDAYDNLETLDPQSRTNYVKANYLRARQLMGNSAWRPAASNLKAVSDLVPSSQPFGQLARYWLSQCYFHDEKYDKAASQLTGLYSVSALDGTEEGSQIPYDLAYSYYRLGQYEKAAKWFDNYLKSGAAFSKEDAEIRRADCDFYVKDYKGAIALYDAIYQANPDPDRVYVYYQEAIACGLIGQDAKKLALLEKVQQAKPGVPYYDAACFELGLTYVEQNEPESAARVFKALRGTTQDQTMVARCLLEVGMIYNKADESQKALRAFKEVAEGMPGTSYAQNALQAIESVYRDLGQPDLYLDYVESIGMAPKMTEDEKELMYFRSAEQIYQTGSWREAIPALENFKTRYPKGSHVAEADFYIGESYYNLGKKDLARDYYSKAADGSDGAAAIAPMRRYCAVSYEIEQFKDAARGYKALYDTPALTGDVRKEAAIGWLRSAYKARLYPDAVEAAEAALPLVDDPASRLEVNFLQAKSLLAVSRRAEAAAIFARLATDPTTPEGAEAAVFVLQDLYDQARFSEAREGVFRLQDKGAVPQYWLARAFIILGDTYAEEDNYKQALRTFESIRDGYDSAAQDDILPTVASRIEALETLMKQQ